MLSSFSLFFFFLVPAFITVTLLTLEIGEKCIMVLKLNYCNYLHHLVLFAKRADFFFFAKQLPLFLLTCFGFLYVLYVTHNSIKDYSTHTLV